MSESADVNVDPCKCPMCGVDNNCESELAKAEGRSENPCWCREYTFSEELLASLPEPAKGTACICRNCVAESQ